MKGLAVARPFLHLEFGQGFLPDDVHLDAIKKSNANGLRVLVLPLLRPNETQILPPV
jgi:hypothetical protein